jgi:hypothetical protein
MSGPNFKNLKPLKGLPQEISIENQRESIRRKISYPSRIFDTYPATKRDLLYSNPRPAGPIDNPNGNNKQQMMLRGAGIIQRWFLSNFIL